MSRETDERGGQYKMQIHSKLRCSTPSSSFLDVDCDLDSYCPSRYGINFAPDLDEKPNTRRERRYVQEKCPEIGDTRLLIPQRRVNDTNFAFDMLTLTSQELIEAREIHCGRLTLKQSHLTKAQFIRLLKRLTYLWNQKEKDIMQYVAESDLSKRLVNDLHNQASPMSGEVKDWNSQYGRMDESDFVHFAHNLLEQNYSIKTEVRPNGVWIVLNGHSIGYFFEIAYNVQTHDLWIVPSDDMAMETQMFENFKAKAASYFLGGSITLENVVKNAERFDVDRVNAAMSEHERAMNAIAEAAIAIKSLVPAMAYSIVDHLVFIIAAGIIYIWYRDDPVLITMVTMMVVAHCKLPSFIASCCAKLVAHLIELAKKHDKMENQADDNSELENWISGFMSLATMVGTAAGVACFDKSDSVMKKFSNFMRTSNTGFSFSQNLTKLFKLIFCQIYFWIYGVDFLGDGEQLIVDKMTAFMTKAKKLVDNEVAQKLSQDLTLYFVIHDIYKEGNDILQEIQESALPRRTITPFMTVFNAVQVLWKEASMIHSAVKKKYMPTWVYLAGDTSVGKSNFQMMLVTYLRERDNLTYTDECIYERQIFNGQKFWDAYRQNYCVSVDDLFQLDDKTIRAEQAVELIKMCNEFQYPLNMAHLVDKGNRYFTSDLVITSTNRLSLGDSAEMGIESIGAFCRRRDFVVYLTLDPDILKRGTTINEIDPERFNRKYGGHVNVEGDKIHLDPRAWRIYLRDKLADTRPDGLKPGPQTPFIGFYEFADMVYQKIQQYKSPSNNLPEYLKRGGVFFNKEQPQVHEDPAIVEVGPIRLDPLEAQGFDADDNCYRQVPLESEMPTPNVPLLDKVMGYPVTFWAFRQTIEYSPFEHCGTFYHMDGLYYGCDITENGIYRWIFDKEEIPKFLDNCIQVRKMAEGQVTYTQMSEILDYSWDYDGITRNCWTHVLWLQERLAQNDFKVFQISDMIIKNYSGDSFFKRMKHLLPKKKSGYVMMETEDHVLNGPYIVAVAKKTPKALEKLFTSYRETMKAKVMAEASKMAEKHPEAASKCTQFFDFTQRNLILPFHEFKQAFKAVSEGDYKPKSVASMMGASLASIDKKYPLLKWLLLGTGGVAVLLMVYVMCKKKFKRTAQANTYYKNQDKNAKRKVDNLVKDIGPLVVQGDVFSTAEGIEVDQEVADYMWQATSDKQGVEILTNRVIPNMAKIVVIAKDFQVQTNILFVKGKQAVVPSHVFPNFVRQDPDAEVYVVFPSGVVLRELVVKLRLQLWYQADVCTVLFTEKFPLFTDLTKHFMDAEKLAGFDKSVFVTLTKTDILMEPLKCKVRPVAIVQKALGISPVDVYDVKTKAADKEFEYETRNGFRSSGLITQKGDCMGVYTLLDKTKVRKLFGLHTAFSPSRGAHGVYVSRQRLEANLISGKVENVYRQDEVVDTHDLLNQGAFPTEPKSLLPLGSVKHGSVFNAVSDIVPSIFHGVLTQPDTAPAVLKASGDLKPVENALNKWNVELHDLDIGFEPTLKEVVSELVHEWGKPDNTVPDVCTQHEALHGLGEVKNLELTTSAGFTLNQTPHNLPGKKSFISVLTPEEKKVRGFTGSEDYYECKPILRNKVLDRLLLASMGVVMNTIWQDSLKDERLELEKVAQARTRLFMTGDVDNTIACRQYFMRFTDHIIKNRHRLPCKVGVNPDGQEWGRMWRWLNEVKNPKFIAGDFKSFDMTIPKWLTVLVVDAILDWFKKIDPSTSVGLYLNHENRKVYLSEIQGNDVDEHNFIRRILMEEIAQSTRINGKVIYRCLQGIPSGHFLTAVFNSIINEVIIKSCLFYYCKVKGIEMNFQIFHENFRMATFGDDHIVSVSEKFQPYFNQQVLQKLIKILFGMGYTDSTKRIDVDEWTDRSELTFLQRYFREEEGKVFAPLKKDIIDEMINWVRISDDYTIKESSFLNLSTALKEWFHWGQQVFEDKKQIFRNLCFKHNAQPFSTTYAGLYSSWLEK